VKLVVFEDDALATFGPMTLLRHASQLRWGTRTLLDSVMENTTDATDVSVWGRNELKDATKLATGKQYNQKQDGWVLLVNARARPDKRLLSLTGRTTQFAAFSGKNLVAARVNVSSLAPGVITSKQALKATQGQDRSELPSNSLFEGYWDLVESNGIALAAQAVRFENALQVPDTVEVRGPMSNLRIHGTAEVERHVTFDTRLGPVVVDEAASIESFSRVMGPCYVGPKTKLLSAVLGAGTSIFGGCKIGGQVENSIVMPHTNKAHLGYVGDSYVGEWVNIGAGSNFSNLKNTYGNVRPELPGRRLDSGMMKVGPVIGDMCKISIGALVFAGKSVGVGSHVTGLADRAVPSFTYFVGTAKKMVELRLESVLETQRRMMERRGKTLGRVEEVLVRTAYRLSSAERREAGVKRGKIT